MTTCQRGSVLGSIRMIFGVGVVSDLTDAQLLERFASRPDESAELAFTTLVARHGPMVLRVCRSVLRDPHDVEDAFQATFLVLVRKAGSIRKRASVGSWLHGVALRAAADIHCAATRRRIHERRFAEGATRLARDACPDDLGPLIHEEVERLPERYRAAVVLCDLEGLTHEEAARRLGWPVGTIKSRQARGRDRLRGRLIRLGLAPSAAAFGSMLAAEVRAAVAPALSRSTVHAALHLSMRTTAGIVATGVLKTMVLARLKALAVTLLTVSTVAIVGISLSLPNSIAPALGGQQTKETGAKMTPASKQAHPTILTLFGTTDYAPETVTFVRTPFDNCRVDKVLVDLGSRVKEGDPLLELFSTDLAAARRDYEVACSRWAHDQEVLHKPELSEYPKKMLIELEKDQQQSRRKMKAARDRLLACGLSDEEVEKVPGEDGFQKARMVLRSRGAGVIVKKTVVPGNFYASNDELMKIARLDRIWVRGNVSEADVDQLAVGQTLKVIFPYFMPDSGGEVAAKLESIDKRLDPERRTARFRTTIPNPGERFKAGAFVRIQVQIPPRPGSAVIPGGSRGPDR